MPAGIMRHNENKQYSYYGNSRKVREKETESLFKAIKAENFPNLETNGHPDAKGQKDPKYDDSD